MYSYGYVTQNEQGVEKVFSFVTAREGVSWCIHSSIRSCSYIPFVMVLVAGCLGGKIRTARVLAGWLID